MEFEITEIDVEYISLVDNPANGFGLVVKSVADGGVKSVPILKTDNTYKTVYGIVYAPDKIDRQGDFARAESIKKAAYKYMRGLRLKNVDTYHNYDQNGSCVVESWIVRKNDELFPDLAGAWAVGVQVDSAAVWDAINNGEITGLSLAGTAVKNPQKKIPELVDVVSRLFRKSEKKEDVMQGAEQKTEQETEQKNADVLESLLQKIKEIKAGNDELRKELEALKSQMGAVQKSMKERTSAADVEMVSTKNGNYISILGS